MSLPPPLQYASDVLNCLYLDSTFFSFYMRHTCLSVCYSTPIFLIVQLPQTLNNSRNLKKENSSIFYLIKQLFLLYDI